MIRDVLVLDTVTLPAPLGLQFWDSLSRRAISDGLVVVTYPPDHPTRRLTARPNHHDVFLIGDASVIVEVHDTYGRFLPFTWSNLTWSPIQPARGSLQRLPLFSAPSRLLPSGLAFVRAELHEPDGTPALGAHLEVDVPGQPIASGLADDHGRVVVAFPYPTPEAVPLFHGSPPNGGLGRQLSDQSWVLPVRAAYHPIRPAPALLDLQVALTQTPATLWADSARTLRLTSIELHFGRDTVLISQNAPHSELFISF